MQENSAGANSDDGYVSVADLMRYFEPCQVEADDLREVAKILLKRRLVEPLEPDRDDFSDDMRIALTPAGEAHQEMAYGDVVYAEQMAMTTGVRLDALRAANLPPSGLSAWIVPGISSTPPRERIVCPNPISPHILAAHGIRPGPQSRRTASLATPIIQIY